MEQLIEQTVEKATGKGVTLSTLKEGVLENNGDGEVFQNQLQEMLKKATVVCMDGNKVKLIRTLDPRALARIQLINPSVGAKRKSTSGRATTNHGSAADTIKRGGDGSESKEGSTESAGGEAAPKPKRKRCKRKVVKGFIPWRKLIAKAVEKATGKGLTLQQLKEDVVRKDADEDLAKQHEEAYDNELQSMLKKGKLVCMDGNKVKLVRSLDPRALARIQEEQAMGLV